MIAAARNVALAIGLIVMTAAFGGGLFVLVDDHNASSKSVILKEQDEDMGQDPIVPEMHQTIGALREVAESMRARGQGVTR